MKETELRIGNFAKWKSLSSMGVGEEQLMSFSRLMYHGFLEPIPLTEEWLLKFGFERSGLYHVKSQVYIYDEYGLVDTGFEYRFNYRRIEIEYVHQLQNLYFALTGGDFL